MTITKTTLLAVLAAFLLPMTASADFIEGQINIGGSVDPFCSSLPETCTMDIADGLDFVNNVGIVSLATEDFASFFVFPNIFVTMADFIFDPFVTVDPLWAGGGFSFTLETLEITLQDSLNLVMNGTGTISGNGFDDTPGAWSFSADAARQDVTFSWSNTTVNSVPEPGTLVLLGLGLFAAGLSRPRIKA